MQQLEDEELREEFTTQVNKLRLKIYSKVKVKTLNGRQLNGKMLLELANSYITAINTGSLPNIQNAWQYVCQNECLRAIQESVSLYEEQVQAALLSAKQSENEEVLKIGSRHAKQQALKKFREKALGQDTIEEFETSLRTELSKKHKHFKQQFLKWCAVKAQEFLKPHVEACRRKLNVAEFKHFDEFK